MLESKIQSNITKRYEKEGWIVIKLIKTTMNGIPDLMCLRNGETLFIEVKRPGKEPGPLQQFRHEELRKQGFDVIILTS
jgi:Holliday junction resolvase